MSDLNQTQNNNLPAKAGKEMVDSLLTKINTMTETGLRMPKDYSAENSLRSAWLLLLEAKDKNGKPVLEVCTQPSIANALLKMVLKGLNPMKQQCAFIAMGDTLTLMEEYPGKIAQAKRCGLKAIHANCVYEGDTFEYAIDPETALMRVTEHKSNIKNVNGGKILGAYAVITLEDGTKNTEIMTMSQIQAAWNQGAARGASPAHKNFPDQMAMKTVMTRAVKVLINSSDDGDLYDDDLESKEKPFVVSAVKTEIANNANKEEVAFSDANVVDSKAPAQTQSEEPKATNENPTPNPGF